MTATQVDPWAPLRPLVGSWTGVGSGFGSTSDVRHDWSFVLDDRFLELRTRSVVRKESGPGEAHEDFGVISRNTDTGSFVFRQFLSEGYVNTYDIVIDPETPRSILFAHREAESAGDVRAQLRLRFVSGDEYEMALDLAFPGKDFAACQEMIMGRAP